MPPQLLSHWTPISIGIVCLLFQLFGEQEAVRYQRELILEGQIWRLLSANFIHLTWGHFGMNMAGLTLIYLLLGENFKQWQWLLLAVICSLGVSIGLLLLDPQLRWYVGFSGALHGLLLAAVFVDVTRQRGVQKLVSIALLAGVVAKLAWEQWMGAMPGSAALAGGPVVVNSHLYGAVVGALIGILFIACKRGNTNPD